MRAFPRQFVETHVQTFESFVVRHQYDFECNQAIARFALQAFALHLRRPQILFRVHQHALLQYLHLTIKCLFDLKCYESH